MFHDNDNAAVDSRYHKVYFVVKVEPNAALPYKDIAVAKLKNVVSGIYNQN